MTDSKNSDVVKLEDQVTESADQLRTLLQGLPQQQCGTESAWNEGDDFTERFNEIWGERVG